MNKKKRCHVLEGFSLETDTELRQTHVSSRDYFAPKNTSGATRSVPGNATRFQSLYALLSMVEDKGHNECMLPKF